MTLDVGEDYTLRFSDGNWDVVQVVSDDGNGWYTIRRSYGHPKAQADAPLKSINIRQVVSIEREYVQRMSWAEVKKAEEAEEKEKKRRAEERLREEREQERKREQEKSVLAARQFGCIAAIIVVFVLIVMFLKSV